MRKGSKRPYLSLIFPATPFNDQFAVITNRVIDVIASSIRSAITVYTRCRDTSIRRYCDRLYIMIGPRTAHGRIMIVTPDTGIRGRRYCGIIRLIQTLNILITIAVGMGTRTIMIFIEIVVVVAAGRLIGTIPEYA
uniref:Uncharacterized protein n=1 Tax=Glossina austeni TaxID=7395 RepID=A0A1A9VS71_GLOAU